MIKIILLLFLVKYFIDIPRSLNEKSKFNAELSDLTSFFH